MRRTAVAVVLAAGGCGGETTTSAPEPASTTVRGVVRWSGARPGPPGTIVCPIPVSDEELVRAWGSEFPPNERSELAADGGMPHAFVWADQGPHREREWPVPAEPFELRVVAAVYRPHVFGLGATQSLRISATDVRTYAPHVVPQGPSAVGATISALPFTTSFAAQAKPVVIQDDVYAWMQAFVFVLDHPFFATTDAAGRFEIRGLPPGEYRFQVWHESFTADRRSIEGETRISLRAGDLRDLDFDLR